MTKNNNEGIEKPTDNPCVVCNKEEQIDSGMCKCYGEEVDYLDDNQKRFMSKFFKVFLVILPLFLAWFFTTKQYFYGFGLLFGFLGMIITYSKILKLKGVKEK